MLTLENIRRTSGWISISGFARRSFLAVALGALAFLPVHHASAETVDQQEAEAFIQSLADRVLAILQDTSLSAEDSTARMAVILREGLDIELVGRFAAGVHWRNAEPEQQQAYLELFEQMIIQTYARRFDEYSGETFSVSGSQPVGKQDALVVTQIESANSPPVKVGWRVRDRGAGPKVIDVDVEGVSMAVTQRNEFAAVIERGGGKFDALIEALEKQVQTAEAS